MPYSQILPVINRQIEVKNLGCNVGSHKGIQRCVVSPVITSKQLNIASYGTRNLYDSSRYTDNIPESWNATACLGFNSSVCNVEQNDITSEIDAPAVTNILDSNNIDKANLIYQD